MSQIILKGVKVHNLDSISVKIPKNKFVIITGVSGSGKSSLAFDTIYAEGRRRYVESLSSYARQFLGIIDRPDIEYIEGLSPAIAIEQRGISKNPRSTVATVTEIYDYLRLLFARIGDVFCYNCNNPIKKTSIDEIVNDIMSLQEGTKIEILSPIVNFQKGEFKDLIKKIGRKGFTRIIIDNKQYLIGDKIKIDKNKKHTIEIIIDRLKLRENSKMRLTQSIETGIQESNGIISIIINEKEKKIYNEHLTCPQCMISYKEITPRLFSFNSPYGACEECHGLGTKMEIDSESLVPNTSLSIAEGAIVPWSDIERRKNIIKLSKILNFSLNTPWENLEKRIKNIIINGFTEKEKEKYGFNYEGVLNYLKKKYLKTDSNWLKFEIEKYMTFQECSVCNGKRLNKEALSVKIGDKNIADIVEMTIENACKWFETLQLEGEKKIIGDVIINEIIKRLHFLCDVGLDYLTLDRTIETLSGGEEQRVRLATQIGSGLSGVLYVLDEPSIGLHARDIERLINTLMKLKRIGNTVLIVEHDRTFIEKSEYIIDMGPLAGVNGGKVVFTGTYNELLESKKSLTGEFLAGKQHVFINKKYRKPNKDMFIKVVGAKEHNLKNIDVKIPLGLMVCVTGVSGSGKSTLVNDILYKALKKSFNLSRKSAGKHKKIENLHLIDKVINIDQSPIGRTPRSNPATYTKVYTPIRDFYASLKESKIRGYKSGRFSFNVKGGRCEACEGAGVKKIEMHFLPDIFVECEVCKGRRFNEETLHVKYKGKNISDVLNMTVDEAIEHFKDIPLIKRKLQLLKDVGLGYIKLGQSAPTLSGGEAQRIKLARELSKQDTGRTLYILDEPTTGLHFYDVKLLLEVLDKLVNKGNTLLIIEHNMDVIKFSDWIIDLGPEGGEKGGYIIAEGFPDDIMKNKNSYTGRFLKKEGF